MAFYVTTPIYYVNAAPHLGHAYTTIAADILARHHRQRGEEVFFLTGTDEHGEPVAQAAEREGVTPKELADRNAQRFEALMPRINVTNDFFIRTSDPRHKAKVQEVMQRIHDNGHTYKGLYEGWYCPRCADFKTESEIGPDNTCPIHKIPLDREREENWFFRLSTFQEPLERLYTSNDDFVSPRSRANEALAFIRGGLQDVSLSRSKLTWGVEVPWDEGHVFYVWFDALLNYYTALSFARDGEDLTDTFWPATLHVIGKDILKFHAVFWPAMLMAAGITRRYRGGVVPDVDVDPGLAADFDGLTREVCELLDRAEITQALERIWQRVRRLNRYVEETAPWQLAKDEAKAPELDIALRSLVEGLRSVTVLLHPYMPETAAKLMRAIGEDALDMDGAAFGARPGGGTIGALEPLFPKPQ